MAVIEDQKRDTLGLLEQHLDQHPWGAQGPVTRLGHYRFDDPTGQIGIEAHLLQRDGHVLHVPLSYRTAPLPDEQPIAVLEHSVLGRRWVYDAMRDPLAVARLERALRGLIDQSPYVAWRRGGPIRTDPNRVTLLTSGICPPGPCRLQVAHLPCEPSRPSGERLLTAAWPGGSGLLFALSSLN